MKVLPLSPATAALLGNERVTIIAGRTGGLVALVAGVEHPLDGFGLSRSPRRVRCSACGAPLPIVYALQGCAPCRARAALELEKLVRQHFDAELEAIDQALELEQLEQLHVEQSARERARIRAAIENFTGDVAGEPGAPGSTEQKP
jgi:hypothetical protein